MPNTKTKKLSREEIFEFLENHKIELKNFKVKRLGLFGSFIRNEQSEESDMDFMVEFEKGGKSFDNFMNLIDFLENAFGYEVELITPESLSTYIKPYVEREVQYVKI